MRTSAFLRGRASFCLPSSAAISKQDPVCSQCSMLQVPEAGRHRVVEFPGQLVPSPRVHCCCCRWHFHLPDPKAPELSNRAQDGGVRSSSLLVSSAKSAPTPQQLLLISVSHWCRSFLYCKETYLRLLIAVWFGALLQTPLCSGARSLGGCGCHCHQSSGQRRMS